MQPVSVMTDIADIDSAFIAAIAMITGTTDVLLLDTWNGVDPVTFEMPEDDREAAVYVERYRRPGRYGLDVSIFGAHRIEPNVSEAEFVRRLARAVGRALVISDCDANPWSWFRFNPDGSIERVYTVNDADDGTILYDLACDLDPADPGFLSSEAIWPAGAQLPPKPEDAPDQMPRAMQTFCDGAAKGGLCETFWAPCPKLRRAER